MLMVLLRTTVSKVECLLQDAKMPVSASLCPRKEINKLLLPHDCPLSYVVYRHVSRTCCKLSSLRLSYRSTLSEQRMYAIMVRISPRYSMHASSTDIRQTVHLSWCEKASLAGLTQGENDRRSSDVKHNHMTMLVDCVLQMIYVSAEGAVEGWRGWSTD